MTMRASSLRCTESQWKLLDQEANAEGISTAQFIREAGLIRAIWLQAVRGEIDRDMERINEMVKQLRD